MDINNFDSKSLKMEDLFIDICCYALFSPSNSNYLIDLIYNNDMFIFEHHTNIINNILYNKKISEVENNYLQKIKSLVNCENNEIEKINVLDVLSLYSDQK